MAKINFESNISDINSLFGRFATTLTGPVTAAITTVRAAMSLLAANPLLIAFTAIVAAGTALFSILRRLQPVIDRLDQGMAVLGATFDFVTNRIGAFFGITEKTNRSFSETVRVARFAEETNQALARSQNELTISSAELRAEQREALLISADQTLSTEERIDALQRANTATEELFRQQREQLTAELANLDLIQSNGDNTIEDDTERARLAARLIELRSEEASLLKETTGQITGLQRAQQTLADTEAKAAQQKIDDARELRQEREIDLAIAGGATEEEVFELRLERAETEDEMAEILHDREVFRIESLRAAEAKAAKEKEEEEEKAAEQAEQRAKDVAEAQMAAAEVAAEQAVIAENTKQDAALATASAITNTLTSLLGDSKGAQIAGLVAQNAFEAASVLVSGTRASAAATAAANAAAVPTFGASLAALPAQLAAITASTTAGLTGVGVATATGIAGILASPGEKPSESGSASTQSAGGAGGGPTVSVPDLQTAGAPQSGNLFNNGSGEMQTVMAVTTDGSIDNSVERNQRLKTRRSLNRR